MHQHFAYLVHGLYFVICLPPSLLIILVLRPDGAKYPLRFHFVVYRVANYTMEHTLCETAHNHFLNDVVDVWNNSGPLRGLRCLICLASRAEVTQCSH